MRKLTGWLVLGAVLSSAVSVSAGERLFDFKLRKIAAEKPADETPRKLAQLLPGESPSGLPAPLPGDPQLAPIPDPQGYGLPAMPPGYGYQPPTAGYGLPMLPPGFGRAQSPLPYGYGGPLPPLGGPLGLPTVAGKPMLLGDGPCPCDLFACVRYKDPHHVHPCAVKQVIAVPDPNPPCDLCGPPKCVYVCICAPPCCPKVKHRGKYKIELDYGDYNVDVTSKNGLVTVDYDD